MDDVSVLLNFFILRQGRSFISLFWVITRGFEVSFTFYENAETGDWKKFMAYP